MADDVIDQPVVFTTAGGVEAEDNGVEVRVEDNLAVRSAGGRAKPLLCWIKLLLGEWEVRAVAPGIGMAFIVADAQDGEGKLLIISGVCAACFYFKARHIARELDGAGVAITGSAVAGAGVVGEHLNVLVAVLRFECIKIKRHTQFRTILHKVGLCAGIVERGAGQI